MIFDRDCDLVNGEGGQEQQEFCELCYRYEICQKWFDEQKQPKVTTGHWIKTVGENGITSAVQCSECGFEDNRYMLFRYCPKCGAKMGNTEESDVNRRSN